MIRIDKEKMLLEALGSRPAEDHDIEQFLMRPQDVIKTARLIGKYTRGSIGLIGDDDHVSLALKVLYPERSIVVLEIDPRVKNSIGKLSAAMCVERPYTLEYDVRSPIPPDIIDSVDHTYINPPYSKDTGVGFMAWCQRGWELSGPNAWSLMSMPCNTTAHALWVKNIQKLTIATMKEAEFRPIMFDSANTALYPTANDFGLTSCLLGYRTPDLVAPQGVIFDSVYH